MLAMVQVERMARLLKIAENVAYTCETAQHFWLLHLLSRWEKFMAQTQASKMAEVVAELFPFAPIFADAPGFLFKGRSYEEDMDTAQVYHYLVS